jgi:AcrR family transcriptional regulator
MQDKKRRIMQAVERLFRTRQFHEVTLEEVARRADVAKGTLYLYFANKEDLFFQTAVAGFDEMCDLLKAGGARHLGPRGELMQASKTISEFFERRRPLFRMIVAEGERAQGRGGSLWRQWLRRRKKLTEALAEIIRHGSALGALRVDVPAEVLAEYLLGMLRTRARELKSLPAAWRTQETLVDLFLSGVARRPSDTHEKDASNE